MKTLVATVLVFVALTCEAAAPSAPEKQTVAEADAKSTGCMSCHTATDRHTRHQNPGVVLGCTDCHGGNPAPGLTQRKAHVQPQHPEFWPTSANPSDDPKYVSQTNDN